MSFRRRTDRQRGLPRPGRITGISAQARSPERLNIELDGEFAFGITTNVALEHGLTTEMEISEELASRLAADEERALAKASALRLLARRPRAEAELRTSLRQRDFGPEAIDAAIERMRELGYLDDEEFARRWVQNRASVAPRGERMLELELRQKGVKADVAKEAIAEADLDELKTAREVALGRLGRYRDLDLPTRRRRLSSFLARRGFSSDTIRSIDRELIRDAPDADDSDPLGPP